jgi:hypothetical protein
VLSAALQAHGYALEAVGDMENAISAWRESELILRNSDDLPNAHLVALELDRLLGDATSAAERQAWFEERGLMNAVLIARRYFPLLAASQTRPRPLETQPASQLQVLGQIRIMQDQQVQPVRGHKRQELLAFLLEQRIAGHQEVNKLDLIDVLYAETDEAQASANLRQSVSTIRAQFGTDVIQTLGNSYSLGEIDSDAETFLRTGDTSLWRGAYLEGEASSVADGIARENLHLALLGQAQTILKSDPDEALRVGKILIAFDVFNLEHLELCVRALQLRNNHKSLNRLYADARNQLLEVAEHIPERWQDFLADRTTNPNVV